MSVQWHIPAECKGQKTRHCHPNNPPHPFRPKMCWKSFMLPWKSLTHWLPTYVHILSTVSYTKKHNLSVKAGGRTLSTVSRLYSIREKATNAGPSVTIGSLLCWVLQGLLPSPPQGSQKKDTWTLLSSTPAVANKVPVHYFFCIFGVSLNM